jgi:hypothetical protein
MARLAKPRGRAERLMQISRPTGSIGISRLDVTDDPGAKEQAAQHGMLSLPLASAGQSPTRWPWTPLPRVGGTMDFTSTYANLPSFSRRQPKYWNADHAIGNWFA